MINAAKAAGLEAHLLDAADMRFEGEFAGIINGALHGMLDRGCRAAIYGGESGRTLAARWRRGNSRAAPEARDTGYHPQLPPPFERRNWDPSVDSSRSYEDAGYAASTLTVEGPTRSSTASQAWGRHPRRLPEAGGPRHERADIGAAIADRMSSDVADYVRLRFIMRKPA